MNTSNNSVLSMKIYLVMALPAVGLLLLLAYMAAATNASLAWPAVIALAAIVPAAFLSHQLVGLLDSAFKDAVALLNAIANQRPRVDLPATSRDLLGQLAYTLSSFQSSLAAAVEAASSSEQSGDVVAKLATLETCDTNVMLADNDLNITYMNASVIDMLSNAESALKTELPNFSAANLMGTCVDDFHKNPAHQRGMLANLKDTYRTDLNVAGLTFGLIATPLFNDNGDRIGTSVEWSDKTERLAKEQELARVAADNLRIKQALDVCDTSVMMADEDLNIIYMNEAVQNMMTEVEGDLRTALPNFSAKNLMGTCVDDFHKKPVHQRGMLKNLTAAYKTELSVAGLSFGLIATPLYDEAGERLGTVVEWDNKTERLAKEQELARVAADNLRIKQALDVCDTSVMLADADLNIIYMNQSVTKMMGDIEGQLRTALPNFSAANLMGTCVDDFHKNPAHQRSMLKDLRDTYKTNLPVAGLTFGLIATPIFDEAGERLGTAVEWDNKTERLAREQEERRLSGENARVKQALDNVSANVMIADASHDIIYMNDAVMGMMRTAEADLRRDL